MFSALTVRRSTMSLNNLNSNEVLNRFRKESIFKDPNECFFVFPDNHPTTWIILRSGALGEFQTFAFYPDCTSVHAMFADETHDDFEEFEMDQNAVLKHFPCYWDSISEWLTKRKVNFKCLDEYD
jgi:hypothetical protein